MAQEGWTIDRDWIDSPVGKRFYEDMIMGRQSLGI
jgi:hypothetical protein